MAQRRRCPVEAYCAALAFAAARDPLTTRVRVIVFRRRVTPSDGVRYTQAIMGQALVDVEPVVGAGGGVTQTLEEVCDRAARVARTLALLPGARHLVIRGLAERPGALDGRIISESLVPLDQYDDDDDDDSPTAPIGRREGSADKTPCEKGGGGAAAAPAKRARRK